MLFTREPGTQRETWGVNWVMSSGTVNQIFFFVFCLRGVSIGCHIWPSIDIISFTAGSSIYGDNFEDSSVDTSFLLNIVGLKKRVKLVAGDIIHLVTLSPLQPYHLLPDRRYFYFYDCCHRGLSAVVWFLFLEWRCLRSRSLRGSRNSVGGWRCHIYFTSRLTLSIKSQSCQMRTGS